MARNRPSPSKLAAEERRIEEARAEILRKQRELQDRLVRIPAVIEQQRAQQERVARERAIKGAPSVSSGRARTSASRRPRRERLTPGRRAQAAKIRFFILLALFALILFLVWRAIPSA